MSQRKYGAVLSYLSIFINIAIGLTFTPFLVRMLGKSEYGVFSIVGAFIAYLAIMDLGLNDSTARFVARYRARNDRESEENFLAIIFLIYSGISFLVIGAGLLILANLPVIFKQSFDAQELATAQMIFAVLLVNVTATILFNSISATIVAYERFVLLRALEIMSNIISTLVICGALVLGYKAVAVVIVTTCVNLAVLSFKIFYAFFKLKIRMKIHRFEWPYVKEIFQYSMAIFVVVIVEQIYWKLDNIILGIMLTPSIVAVYAIGMSFHKYFMSFSTAISKVMLPKIVQKVELGGSGKELTDILISVSRIQAIVLMLILSGLILFGREFITLWIGPGYELAYYVMLVTLIPYSLELIGNIRNVILQAKGLYWYRSMTVLSLALINIPVTVLLIKLWGMVGASIATGGGILIGYFAINHIMKIKADIDIRRYSKELMSGILPAVLLSCAIGMALKLIPEISWLAFIAKAILFTLVYILFMWFLGMNDYEKNLIKSLNPWKNKNLKPADS